MQKINANISKQYDKHLDRQLADCMLERRFASTRSATENKKLIDNICDKLNLDSRQTRYLNNVLKRRLQSSGMKASVRGGRMNEYVKKTLSKFLTIGELCFEKKHAKVPCIHEIPDWTWEVNGQIFIGFNQLDLWNGGAQLNRAAKYIMDNTLHQRLKKKNIYIICLVARKIHISSENKVSRIIQHGLKHNRLFWLNGLKEFLMVKMKGASKPY